MPTLQTTRLLELGATALRAERITEADVDVTFYRDAIRNLVGRIANGESIDAPQRQLAALNDSLFAAIAKRAQWASATLPAMVAAAITDIRNDPQ